MTLFSGGAVLPSAIGVYGLMAFAVQQRTAKIEIRMALGADRNRVRGMVLRQGMTLAVSGMVAGIVLLIAFCPRAFRVSVRRGSTRSNSFCDSHIVYLAA